MALRADIVAVGRFVRADSGVYFPDAEELV